jgi:two-component system, NtrC family, nitrogen regulation sensor histidine kinase NtrY
MQFLADPRRRPVPWLTVGAVLVFVLLGTLNWFNTSRVDFLTPETYGQTLVLTALEWLLFLLLLLLLALLFRNILKIYVGEGSSGVGARLRSRMVLGAALITVTPAVLMALFSYTLMNRSLERWFSPDASQLRDDSASVVRELAEYVTGNARVEAESIAASGALDQPAAQLQQELASHRITLDGGFAVVFDKDRSVLASFQAPPLSSAAMLQPWLDDNEHVGAPPLRGPLSSLLLSYKQRSNDQAITVAGQRFALGTAVASSGKIVVVALPMPQGLSQTMARIRSGAEDYLLLFRSRRTIRTTLFLTLLLVTVFIFFASVWLAVFLSKQITRPVEALAVAMDEIAAGKYEHRVPTLATGEMAELVRSFNHMASDLETSRQLALSAQTQLTEANQAIEERRRELETIVETIPSGVVTLDAAGTVLKANRAFASLMGLNENAPLAGQNIAALLPAECSDDLAGVIRRGSRMGAASIDIELHARGRTAHLAITSARLDLGNGRTGSVLVVEDTTELLRAERQMAWKEVAQQVAHEIKIRSRPSLSAPSASPAILTAGRPSRPTSFANAAR